MTAPYFMLTPFERHYDAGFGATGNAFHQAAEALGSSEARFSNNHLPRQFLYRHAIELYLKSIIIVLSKTLCKEKNIEWAPPQIGSKSLFSIHSIDALHKHANSILTSNWGTLRPRCKTDWSILPSELEGWINTIEEHDPKSSFYRYPGPSNSAAERSKSLFQRISPDDAVRRVNPGGPPGVGLYFVDDNDVVTEAFMTQAAPLQELETALKGASSLLSGAHMGIRMEFAGGW